MLVTFGLGDYRELGVEETLVSGADPEGTAEVRTSSVIEAR